MPLAAGQTLTFYEILGPLGAGGMGEVYRARDTRLEREVAIKVLPESLADDEERLRRFEREAKTLASLNHPNVAGIHGVDQQDEVCFLALELVPGEDLATRSARGPLPVAEAIDVCRQIAEGLEAAHEAGVVHRDLKPANIRITPDGVVKLLDFGLAKPIRPRTSGESGTTTAESDSFLMTEEGLVLGTPTYMSPEQARGRPVDRRTDIWAFGCVLYECLTGVRVFRGDSLTDVLSAIVSSEPDWAALPASLPAGVRRLLRRCLEKDPRRRLRDVGEARIELEAILAGRAPEADGPAATAPAALTWRRALPWGLVALLLVALVVQRRPPPSAPVSPTRLDVLLTTGGDLTVDAGLDGPLAVLSPDGQALVYLARSGAGRRLFLRRLDELAGTPLEGTEDATGQFFSPDGAWIAFFAKDQLQCMPLAGGTPTPIAAATNARGGSWGERNTIVFAAGVQEGLSRVSSLGGAVESLTTLEPNERTHRWPAILPGGTHVLFGCQQSDGSYDEGTIEVAPIAGGERKVLIEGGTFPRYVDGHLFYARGSTLYAARFDVDALELLGEPQPVLSGMQSSGGAVGSVVGGNGAAQISIADDGTAVYLSGAGLSPTTPLRLVIVDRSGRTLYEHPESLPFRDPRLSPDGEQVVLRIDDVESHLYLLNPQRGTLSQITFESSGNAYPAWSSDGSRIAYVSDWATDDAAVWLMPMDGSGAARVLCKPGVGGEAEGAGRELMFHDAFPSSFSPDGRRLAVSAAGRIDLVSIADGTTTTFLDPPSPVSDGQFSPDGKWMAYMMSSPMGVGDVYVCAYPGGGALRRISSSGGFEHRWSRNGQEIVYVDFTGALMAVDVSPEGGALTLGTPHRLLDLSVAQLPIDAGAYDVSPDGSRFAVLVDEAGEEAASRQNHVTMVFHFLDVVRRATAGTTR